MSAISEKTSEGVDDKFGAEVRSEGQIPCVLVFSDRKHVSYINQIVNCLEELLPSLGFKVNKLCVESPPNAHFGEYFEKLAHECVLGIVILDGFRPNVLFEYGFLRGKGKVVIPLQDKKARIAVKSLYSIDDLSNEGIIKIKTGLTRSQFIRLKEPSLGYFGSLSDRHGINVIVVDCDAELKSDEHPKQKVKTEIEKLMPQILDNYANETLRGVKQETPQYLEEFQEVTLKILKYYTQVIGFEYEDLVRVTSEIEELESKSGAKMPSSTYVTVVWLYEKLAEREQARGEVSRMIMVYGKAIELCERILKDEKDRSQIANIQFRMGFAYYKLSEVRDKEENIKKAIKAYNEALKIRTKEDYPLDYANIQNNIGVAYRNLSLIRDKEKNLKKAIKAYNEALKIRTKEDYPLDYVDIQNNIELAYSDLPKAKDKEKNIKKAIKAYNEALKIRTKEDYPLDYAMTQNNLGTAYGDLGIIRDKEKNLKKAIKALNEALKIYTKEDYPLDYAMTQNNLKIAYKLLKDLVHRTEVSI